MLNFNLEYYRAFYSVAQLGSISKAAEALCLSQPAVTRSVQKLRRYEAALGGVAAVLGAARGIRPRPKRIFGHTAASLQGRPNGRKRYGRRAACASSSGRISSMPISSATSC